MTTPAADDYESIARYLKELEADRQLARTGSSAPEKPTENEYLGEAAIGWPYVAYTLQKFSYCPHGEDEPFVDV